MWDYLMYDMPDWYIVVVLLAIAATGGIIFVWNQYYYTHCTRCTKKMLKTQTVSFLGVADMCEPCENIASYYNQQQ